MPKNSAIRRALVAAAALAVAAATLSPLAAMPAVAASVRVTTSAQLVSALASAKPGDVIALADGTYTGKFTATSAGTSSAPITLIGSRKAVLTTGSTVSGYALRVTASYWKLSGFSISKASKGLVLDNSDNTVVDGLDIGSIGLEALHVRTSSSSVIIRNSIVHDTGLDKPEYGEGIYIGSANSNWASIMGSSSSPDRSDFVLIENNIIRNTSAEGIDIKEGTVGGRVLNNTFERAGYSGANYGDSWVDVKGNGYTLTGNSGSGTRLDAFQVHTAMNGWGDNNSFSGNTVISGVPGFEVNVQSGATGTKVTCDSSNAASGLTNVTCTAGGSTPTPTPTTSPTVPTPTPTPTATSSSLGVALTDLNGSTRLGTFTVVVTAPAGSTVKFKLDGIYLGQDSTAPYTWPVSASAGSHKINARWDVNGVTTSVDATFTVK